MMAFLRGFAIGVIGMLLICWLIIKLMP